MTGVQTCALPIYRMMTSRAEYRLILRQDNADLRLTRYGYEVGLIDEKRYRRLEQKRESIEKEIARAKAQTIGATAQVQELLASLKSTPLKSGVTLAELITRPELSYDVLKPIDKNRPALPAEVTEQVEIELKYEGYIKRQMSQVAQFKKMEHKKIPVSTDYDKIPSLRIEARQKLKQVRPENVGQASRISGVSPADISVLLVYLARG